MSPSDARQQIWWSNGERRQAGRIEQPALPASRHRHPDCVADPLAERAGGDLDARGVPVLWVAGRTGSPGPQGLQVVEFEAEAAEVELDVEGQAGVAAREHEAVPARPLGSTGLCRITFGQR